MTGPGPLPASREPAGGVTDRGAVDKAVLDRDRLYRLYRAAKQQQYEELFASPVHGERLRKFRATLNHFGIEDADRMVAFVQSECRKWLREAPEDIRAAALEMSDRRVQRIRARAGLVAFDDPLPGDSDDVFRLCKKALGL